MKFGEMIDYLNTKGNKRKTAGSRKCAMYKQDLKSILFWLTNKKVEVKERVDNFKKMLKADDWEIE